MNSDCRKCLFYEKCRSLTECEFFTPIDEDDDKQDDHDRYEYYEEWFKYIDEDDN